MLPVKKLNVGCGSDIREGYVNLDRIALSGVDVAWDLNHRPLPFANEAFEEILCLDILEHLDYIPLLGELHRILKPGGKIVACVPHFTSKNAYADPTHRHFFSYETFLFFGQAHERAYYFDFHFTRASVRLEFNKQPYLFWNYFLEQLLRLHWSLNRIYEITPLRVFPAHNIWVELTK